MWNNGLTVHEVVVQKLAKMGYNECDTRMGPILGMTKSSANCAGSW